MGIPERKQREKEERRQIILLKAKELVLEHGVEYLNMQEIADGVELSKATLYLYFENKEAILNAILDEASTAFAAYVRESARPGASGLEAIHSLWAAYLSFFGESEDLFILTGITRYVDPDFPMNVDLQDPDDKRPVALMTRLIAEVLKLGVEDGSFDPAVDPSRTALVMVAVVTSMVDQIARLPRRARDNRRNRDFLHDTFEIFLRGLAARNADRSLLALPTG